LVKFDEWIKTVSFSATMLASDRAFAVTLGLKWVKANQIFGVSRFARLTPSN
jgi:hypothetical protein